MPTVLSCFIILAKPYIVSSLSRHKEGKQPSIMNRVEEAMQKKIFKLQLSH